MTQPEPAETLFGVFDNWTWTPDRLRDYQTHIEQSKPYLLCVTPRSGSTYFCELLRRTRSAGIPAEYLRPDSARAFLERRAEAGEHDLTLLQYMGCLLDRQSSRNGAFGIKASYVQYSPFVETGLDRLLFSHFRKVRLYRKSLVDQGISLHLATATGRWHSHLEPDAPSSESSPCAYDEERIRMWIAHLWDQERGWDSYFEGIGEDAPVIWYEALQRHPLRAIRRLMRVLGVSPKRRPAPARSEVQKIGDARNREWATRFVGNEENVAFMRDQGIHDSRFCCSDEPESPTADLSP